MFHVSHDRFLLRIVDIIYSSEPFGLGALWSQKGRGGDSFDVPTHPALGGGNFLCVGCSLHNMRFGMCSRCYALIRPPLLAQPSSDPVVKKVSDELTCDSAALCIQSCHL